MSAIASSAPPYSVNNPFVQQSGCAAIRLSSAAAFALESAPHDDVPTRPGGARCGPLRNGGGSLRGPDGARNGKRQEESALEAGGDVARCGDAEGAPHPGRGDASFPGDGAAAVYAD